MVCNPKNCLKAALLFTIGLVAVYGLNAVQSPTQAKSDSLSAKSLAGST